jgi:hypothetical protein
MQPREGNALGPTNVFLTLKRSQGHPQPNALLSISIALLSVQPQTACPVGTPRLTVFKFVDLLTNLF